jgi:hypothetical protein
MIKRWILIGLLLSSVAVMAQDAEETQEPDAIEYTFEFPIPAPTDEQIDEAYNCKLSTDPQGTNDDATQEATQDPETSDAKATACELANHALKLAAQRGDGEEPSQDEYDVFYQIIEANPALALRLDVIAVFFNAPALVAPPEMKAITSVHLTYTFSGLGPSNDYDITITNADTKPEVSGTVSKEGGYEGEGEATEEPISLPETVDADVVQALAPAMSDLLPIETQFSSVPCWDYYPDWTVELTFADKTTLTFVTNKTNIVGIGGPWQVEIDDQNYMQYSGAFAEAVANLLDVMNLPLGETAAMGCGGITDPLFDAFPRGGN